MFDKESKKISVDVFSKATNSFTYVLPNTCFPKSNIENIPERVALRLRRVCDSDNKFEKRSKEYQSYFIAKDYKPRKVKNSFQILGTFLEKKPGNLKRITKHFLLYAI